jgi:thiamine kinase-like enzyme
VVAAADRLRPLWEAPRQDAQPLQGDAHPGNLIATRDGGLVWIDFEDNCLGPVEWDLATIMDPDAVAARHQPDPEMLARCTVGPS